MNVNVVENSDNTVHITMPMAPDGHHDLSDEEFSAAAGGALETKSSTACSYVHHGTDGSVMAE